MSKQTSQSERIKKLALQQTSSADTHNPTSLKKLADTIDDRELQQQQEIQEIQKNLSATLNDDELSDTNIDFHYDELMATSETVNYDLHVSDFLKDNIIPGRYTIKHLLGSGTSGQVFSVHDNNLYRNIAAKFMHPSDLESEEKTLSFIQEARITANLDHPNILPVHDLNYTDGGLIYFTMDQVEGDSLDTLLDQYQQSKQLPDAISSINERINIILQVCNAIAHAHSLSIIHNDIKPSNIMIGHYGEVLTVDWGTACSEDFAKKSSTFGTPVYMSPEQARDHVSDHRSDIYCIGTTLFHLLTLRIPCWHEDIDKFWEMKCAGIYSPPTTAERKHIPKELLSIAEKSMSVDPDQRYQNVQDIILDIEAYQHGQSISAYNDGVTDVAKRIYRHNRKAVLAGISGLLAICCIMLILYLEKNQSQKSWLEIDRYDFNNLNMESLEHSWTGLKLPEYSSALQQKIHLSDSPLWYPQNEALHFDALKESAVYNLVYKHRISGNMRISFDYTPMHNTGNLNCFLAGSDRNNGYMFHIGGWKMLGHVRLTKHNTTLINVKMPFAITENTTYHIQMEREENFIRLYVNDLLLVDYTDLDALNGLQHQQFGIEFPTQHSFIDNVIISHQPLPQKVSPLSIAHAYFDNGLYTEAMQIYKNIRKTYDDTDMRSTALYRIGRCLSELGQIKQSGYVYKQFSKEYPQHALTSNVTVNYLGLLARMHDWKTCEDTLFVMANSIKESAMRETLFAQLNHHLNNYARRSANDTQSNKRKWNARFLDVTPKDFLNRLKEALQYSQKFARMLHINYTPESDLLFEFISESAASIGAWEFQVNELSISKRTLFRGLSFQGKFEEIHTSLADHPRSIAFAYLLTSKIEQLIDFSKTHPNALSQIHNSIPPQQATAFLKYFPDDRDIQLDALYYNQKFKQIVSDYKDLAASSDVYLASLYHLQRYDEIFPILNNMGNNNSIRLFRISLYIKLGLLEEAQSHCNKGTIEHGYLLMAQAYQEFYRTGELSSFDEFDGHPMYGVLHRYRDLYLLRPLNALYLNNTSKAKQTYLNLLNDKMRTNIGATHRAILQYIVGQISPDDFLDSTYVLEQEKHKNLDGYFNLYTGIRLELEGRPHSAISHYKIAMQVIYAAEIQQYLEWRLKAIKK